MRHNIISILSALLILITLTSCAETAKNGKEESKRISSSDTEVIRDYSQAMPNDFVRYEDLVNPVVSCESVHYQILEADNSMYYCYIYGSEHNIVFEQGFKSPHYPQIEAVSDDIIELSVGYGTGLACRRYYSISRDCFSVDYWYVSATQPDEELVAYMYVNSSGSFDDRYFVIRNIFDKSEYYRTFSLQFAPIFSPIESIEFINGGKEILISYATEQNGDIEYITKRLNLS